MNVSKSNSYSLGVHTAPGAEQLEMSAHGLQPDHPQDPEQLRLRCWVIMPEPQAPLHTMSWIWVSTAPAAHSPCSLQAPTLLQLLKAPQPQPAVQVRERVCAWKPQLPQSSICDSTSLAPGEHTP